MSAFWDSHARTIDPLRYRAEGQYLSEQASYPYEAMLRHVLSSQGAWVYAAQPGDDGAYGATTRLVQGRMVSRDLLDSCVELGYLSAHLGVYSLANGHILDIGAGYGRLAHRLHEALPTAKVYCTDPVPESRAVCAQYLAHRGIEPLVYAPGEIERLPPLTLAMAVHVWHECTAEEVRWWLGWLADHKVPHLFAVPHTSECMSNPSGVSWRHEPELYGYELQDEWRGPACWPRTLMLYRRVR